MWVHLILLYSVEVCGLQVYFLYLSILHLCFFVCFGTLVKHLSLLDENMEGRDRKKLHLTIIWNVVSIQAKSEDKTEHFEKKTMEDEKI